MTPERWQEIEALYHAVRARPVEARSAYLVEASAGDEALRLEVESLLAQPVSAEGMLDRPAADAVPMTSDLAGDGALAGRRLGAYLFQERIGAGGMGEVYRAQDVKLRRDVAIKILPRAFTNDPDRLARFEREARLLASLNHPNIGAIYGLEELDPSTGSGQALVLELVEGETLAERIRRGPIPLAEALPIARQIADALEAAHEHGIVHRDLKPANIKVRGDGTVKVLDFGLAKAMEPPAGASPNVSQSPTVAPAMSDEGMILGTAAYMSPEQARGKTVDKRADVWAFGAVLFEMLTGKRAFRGATVPDTIAAVLEREPDWTALPAATPVSIRRLLERCLTKDPKRRLRDIGDASLDLAPPGPAESNAVATRPNRRAWIAIAVLLVALVAVAIPAVRYFRSAQPPAPDVRLEIPLPPGVGRLSPVISPDGRRVVYSSPAGIANALWVRSLNAVGAVMLPGTEGASQPSWSPDSGSVVFSVPAERKLKKVDVAGGPPQVFVEVGGAYRGGTWNRDGIIVYSTTVLRRIAASGGDATDLTELDKSLEETFHAWPSFLPDGRHFLYLAWSRKPENRAVYMGSLESKTRARLMAADSRAIYAAPGYVLFGRGGALVARQFDPHNLEFTGDAVTLAEKFSLNEAGGAAFNASDDGTLVYTAGGMPSTTRRRLWLMDRTGKRSELVGALPSSRMPRFSPDGKRVAFSETAAGGVENLWIYDIDRGIKTRLTTDPSLNHDAVWSPDGSRLVFDSNRGNYADRHALYEKLANGTTQERLLLEAEPPGSGWGANDWSRDGRLIVLSGPSTDLWVLPLSGDRKPFRYLTTPFDETHASLSPNGRWLAYSSNESGSYQVVVRSFPDPSGDMRQISTEGGASPRWRGDGGEIYYLDPRGRIVAVAVTADQNLEVGKSTPLFDTTFPRPEFFGAYPYDVTSDGQRFLISAPPDSASTSIVVIPNWSAGLKPQ